MSHETWEKWPTQKPAIDIKKNWPHYWLVSSMVCKEMKPIIKGIIRRNSIKQLEGVGLKKNSEARVLGKCI